jgi:uncharacterized protein (TIGR02996 family)
MPPPPPPPPPEVDDDEIVAEITDALQELVNDGHLELASSRAAVALAGRLLPLLEGDPDTDIAEIADFLLERDEVSELYIEGDELAAYFRPVFRRLRGGDDEGGPKHHPDLFAAMVKAPPEDLQARAVYADWLQENGDPRGELMILQLAQAKPKLKKADKERLAQQQRNLIAKHRTHFYSDLTMGEDIENRIRGDLVYGFFEDVHVSDEFNLKTLLTIESGRLLRRLTIESAGTNPVSSVLSTCRLPESLQVFIMTDTRMAYPATQEPQVLDLGAALRGRSFPRLEVISATCPKIVLADVAADEPPFPALRNLALTANALDSDAGAFLATNLPNLASFELTVNDLNAGAIGGIGALLRAPPPKLRSVTLSNVAVADVARAFAHTLLTGPGASQLQRLDFTNLQLDDTIGTILLALPDTLTDVVLRGNQFATTQPQLVERWPKCGAVLAGADDDWDYDEDEDGEDDEYDESDE